MNNQKDVEDSINKFAGGYPSYKLSDPPAEQTSNTCDDILPPSFDPCGEQPNNQQQKLRRFKSGATFDELGNYLGQSTIEDGKVSLVSAPPPHIDLSYLRSTLYRGYDNKTEPRWIFAFDTYNANNPSPLDINSPSSYVKALKFLHDRRHKAK